MKKGKHWHRLNILRIYLRGAVHVFCSWPIASLLPNVEKMNNTEISAEDSKKDFPFLLGNKQYRNM